MDLFSQQFGAQAAAHVDPTARQSVDSVDELVARNIREVLSAVQLDDVGPAAASAPARPGSGRPQKPSRQTSLSKATPSADAQHLAGTAPVTAFSLSAITAVAALPDNITTAAAAVGASSAGDGPSASSSHTTITTTNNNTTALLDVPGHAEATIRLHKARIRALEEEHAKLTKALAERDQALAESSKEVRAMRNDKAVWAKEKKALEAQVERLQRKASEAEAALANHESAAKEVGRETSRLEKERRAVEADARARDVRLQRALDEVARYKALLEELKSQDRDAKGAARGEVQRLEADNRRLERQRGELLVAFRKQLRLLDLLKRQRLHLEASRALQFSEAEFLQLLEMGGGGGGPTGTTGA